MKSIIEVICVAVVLGAVFLFAVSRENNLDVEDTRSTTTGARVWLAQISCEQAGGSWNACGSACRTEPEAACIDVCVEYCECRSDDECPSGFSCRDYLDDVGVCKVKEAESTGEEVEKTSVEDKLEIEEVATQTNREEFEKDVNLAVPFTSQAPHKNWEMPYQEFCEEASLYMVAQYYEGVGEGLIDARVADAALISISDLEESLEVAQDVTIDELALVAQAGWNYTTRVLENPTVEQIKNELSDGHPVIVPLAGRLLGNPFFTQPGPVYHMLVVRGFTSDGKFITNDPGTYRGEGYQYDFDTVMNAIHDWNGGEEITQGKKVALIVIK